MARASSKVATPSLRELVRQALAIGRQRAVFATDWRSRYLSQEA
jgi:hypothetical protein